MESFVIEGGTPLGGRVSAAGNKNGALPILAATLLASEPVTLSNVPRIRDVDTMVALLADVGAETEWTGRERDPDRPEECGEDRARRRTLQPDPRLVPPCRAAARPLRPRERPASGRRRDRAPAARPARPRAGRARRRDGHQRPLRHDDLRPPGPPDLPRRGERHGDGERRDGGHARHRRDRDRKRRLRAARAGSLPLPRLARRQDRGHRLQRPPRPRCPAAGRRGVADRAGAHRGRELHRAGRGHGRRRHGRKRRDRGSCADPAGLPAAGRRGGAERDERARPGRARSS